MKNLNQDGSPRLPLEGTMAPNNGANVVHQGAMLLLHGIRPMKTIPCDPNEIVRRASNFCSLH